MSDRRKPGKDCKGEVLAGGHGDEVEQLVDLASIGWKSPLDRRLRTRMATRPIQFTGMEERHTPKCELLRTRPRVDKSTPSTIYLSYPDNHVSHPVNSLKPNLTEAKP